MRGYQAGITGMVRDDEEGMRGYQAEITGMARDDEEGMRGYQTGIKLESEGKGSMKISTHWDQSDFKPDAPSVLSRQQPAVRQGGAHMGHSERHDTIFNGN